MRFSWISWTAILTWAQPTDREIPLMEMVYSGYTIFFASPCDITKSDRFFCYAQGQAWMDGRQNGWMSLDLFFKPENHLKADYLRACGRLRVATKPFLVYGRLLGPVEPLEACADLYGRWVWMEQRPAHRHGARRRGPIVAG